MRIRLRVLIVTAVVALSAWTIYPPHQTIRLGLDLNGGLQLILRVKTEQVEPARRNETVEQALQIIERRVNPLGVAEPVVARYGSDDRSLVQLPGVSDVAQARGTIQKTAQLRLTLLESGPFASREEALRLTVSSCRHTSSCCRGPRLTANPMRRLSTWWSGRLRCRVPS